METVCLNDKRETLCKFYPGTKYDVNIPRSFNSQKSWKFQNMHYDYKL